jgi:hypothetical protein
MEKVDLSGRSNQPDNRAAQNGRAGAFCAIAATAAGCEPSLDILGVYFPGWLVSGVVALAVAYALVWWLGRRPNARTLAQSGLFFCGLVVMLALLIWWIFFSGF